MTHTSLHEVGDVEQLHLGDRFPVWPGPLLRASGWRGGQFVRYVPGPQDWTVEASDGNEVAGFLIPQSEKYTPLQPGSFGSNGQPVVGSPENFRAHQYLNGLGGQNVVTLGKGGGRAYFKLFETVALDSGTRTGGPVVWVLNETVWVSERGRLCNDSEGELTAAGVSSPVSAGIVSAIPSQSNGWRLGVDLNV